MKTGQEITSQFRLDSISVRRRANESNPEIKNALRLVCVARHAFLSEHIARFFTGMGLQTRCAVGLEEALETARHFPPDVVVCDYDLLATLPLETWEQDELLSRTAVIAVSLTRRPTEVHLLDVNGIAGFLYLPTLEPDVALKFVEAAASKRAVRLPKGSTLKSPLTADKPPEIPAR